MEKQFLLVDAANPTWLVYVAVLVVAVYFRFSRFFSIRNLDLALVLMLSTALVLSGEWKNRPWVPGGEDRSPSADGTAVSDVASAGPPATAESHGEAATAESGRRPTVSAPVSLPVSAVATDDSQSTTAQESPRPVANKESAAEVVAAGDSPGPRAESESHPVFRWSFYVLLALSVLLMVRLVFDEALTRRPRLEQNLNLQGITFLCFPALVLLAVSVFLTDPPDSTIMAVEHGKALLARREVVVAPEPGTDQPPAPTETLLGAGAAGVAQLSENFGRERLRRIPGAGSTETLSARVLVVIAHVIVVMGLLYIGRKHFGSLQIGLSMSCLYLLLPCTAFHVHQLSHILPAACLIWAVACYRRPAMAGVLLGLACGTLFFTVFLLPLWAVFYGRRGSLRFGASLVGVAVILAFCLMLTSSDADSFISKIVTAANWTVYRLLDDSTSLTNPGFGQLFIRIPMAALFFVMLTAMTVLPRPRNLEGLLANSTVLVVAAQLWYPDDIGMYVMWYLPLLLLVVFRPRLDRFVPPEMMDRSSAAMPAPPRKTTASAVAMNRYSHFR